MIEDVILKAENLYFSYDDDKSYALNGVSLEIKKGQKIAFMGANGSGKSTFFLCCIGILKPKTGKLSFDGQYIKYDKKGLLDLRSKIGIVFQDPDNQLFCSSVYQEISFGVLNLGICEKQAKIDVENIITELEITPFKDRPTHALSGGQKKQVSIADILVMRPKIIILDEPAAALDPKHTQIVNNIVDKMVQNSITVIMSTHDVDYAYEWADEIVLFDKGKVIMQAKPVDVFTNKQVLEKTNLSMPTVLTFFESLCNENILDSNLSYPKNFQQLKDYVKNTIYNK